MSDAVTKRQSESETISAKRRVWPFALTCLLFAALPTGAWAWFHAGTTVPENVMRLEVRSQIPGWTFEPEAISEQAMSILKTTDLFNGSFVRDSGERVTVFAAEWDARDGTKMDVVGHTPDVCWVGVGWGPVQIGQPQKIVLSLDREAFPFECRVFETPDTGRTELVLWTTILNGKIVDEGERWTSEDSDSLEPDRRRRFDSARRRASNLFKDALLSRRPATGTKQFTRLSVPCSRDWPAAMAKLEEFAPQWMTPVYQLTSQESDRIVGVLLKPEESKQ